MWKIAVGFIVFAAVAMFVISKGGDKVDMGGEQPGAETSHSEPAPAVTPAAPESAASAAK